MKSIWVVGILAFPLSLLSACNTSSPEVADPSGMSHKTADGFRCWGVKDQSWPTSMQVSYVKDKAKSGNETCQIMLGLMYEMGRGVPQDYIKARSIFKELGDVHPESYSFLASMLEAGKGGPVDLVGARALYEKSYKAGGAGGAAKYAEYLAEGKGGSQDKGQAMAIALESTERYGDEAWKVVTLLRAQGVTMSEQQAAKYNSLWVARLQSSLKLVSGEYRAKLRPVLASDGPGKVYRLKMRFDEGVSNPVVTMYEPSGSDLHDSIIVSVMEKIEMKDFLVLPDGRRSQEMQVNFSIDPYIVR